MFTITAFVLATGYFGYYFHRVHQPGGAGWSSQSWTGLGYGIAGFAMMIFCGLLGVRRSVRIWRLGRGQSWLRAHIWLGLLAFPLIYYHAGMRFGHNLTLVLMILFAIVLVSGIFGVVMQNVLPRAMLTRIQAETSYEQIPHIIDVLRKEADGLVANVCGPLGNEPAVAEAVLPGGGAHVKREGAVQGKVVRTRGTPIGPQEGSGPLKSFYLAEVQPFLHTEMALDHKLATSRSAIAVFEHARTLVPDPLHDTLKDLESVCEERRQLALQVRLHHWLHVWEFVHVPISYALLVLSAVHAVVATLKY